MGITSQVGAARRAARGTWPAEERCLAEFTLSVVEGPNMTYSSPLLG